MALISESTNKINIYNNDDLVTFHVMNINFHEFKHGGVIPKSHRCTDFKEHNKQREITEMTAMIFITVFIIP